MCNSWFWWYFGSWIFEGKTGNLVHTLCSCLCYTLEVILNAELAQSSPPGEINTHSINIYTHCCLHLTKQKWVSDVRNGFPKATTVTGAGIKALTQQEPHEHWDRNENMRPPLLPALGEWESAFLLSVCSPMDTAGPQYSSVGSQTGKCRVGPVECGHRLPDFWRKHMMLPLTGKGDICEISSSQGREGRLPNLEERYFSGHWFFFF